MKDKDLHQIIEQQDKEKKAVLYSEFEKKYNITAKQPDKRKLIVRVSACATAIVAIICLIVAIPIIVQNNKGDITRYCSINDCIVEDLNYTVKDYAADNDLNLLYIDWYDIADEVQTKIFLNKNDRTDIIFFQETIVNSQNGIIVELYITNQNTSVDTLAFYEEICKSIIDINGVSVNWDFRNSSGLAFFLYKGYKYYIVLDDIADETVITDIIDEMISNSNK